MNLLNLFKSQREFIRGVVEKKALVPAVVIGILGIYSFPITSFLARVALKTNLKNEIFQMLVKDPLISILYFSLSVIIIFLVSRLFKGENRFFEYVIASGFGGIYSILVSLTLAPISFLSNNITQNGQINQSISILAVFLAFTGIIASFYGIKYSIISISEVFRLKILKSIVIWIITFIPLFLLINEMWKLS